PLAHPIRQHGARGAGAARPQGLRACLRRSILSRHWRDTFAEDPDRPNESDSRAVILLPRRVPARLAPPGDRDGLLAWALHRPDPPAAPFRSTDSSPDVGWRRAWRGRLAPRTDRLRKFALDRAGSSRRAARANP